MNGALRRWKTSRQPFVRRVPDVIAERDGLKIRATASSGNTERPNDRGFRWLSFAGQLSETAVCGFCVSLLCVSLLTSIIISLPIGEGCRRPPQGRPSVGSIG